MSLELWVYEPVRIKSTSISPATSREPESCMQRLVPFVSFQVHL